jgi:hypothetical protein
VLIQAGEPPTDWYARNTESLTGSNLASTRSSSPTLSCGASLRRYQARSIHFVMLADSPRFPIDS